MVPHETAKFLDFFCATTQPQQILEIGTAIGFSASLMAQHSASDGHLTTIDRYALMFVNAKFGSFLEALLIWLTRRISSRQTPLRNATAMKSVMLSAPMNTKSTLTTMPLQLYCALNMQRALSLIVELQSGSR